MNDTQLADAHLTYIASTLSSLTTTAVYDVYAVNGGQQLGDVYRSIGGMWTARKHGWTTAETASAKTRWKAATMLWPA